MINSLKVKRKDGEIIEIKLRELKLSDINKIIKMLAGYGLLSVILLCLTNCNGIKN